MFSNPLKTISNWYNLFLSIGALYVGIAMLSGSGVFATFPEDWIGKVPFANWAIIALFGILLFGLGNGITSIYGFIKKDNKLFIFTIIMGALFLLCTVIQIISLGEWYLATGQFMLFSLIQIMLGSFGLITKKPNS